MEQHKTDSLHTPTHSFLIGNKLATKFKLRHSLSKGYWHKKTFSASKIEEADLVSQEDALYIRHLYASYTGYEIEIIPVE
jgi:hypothetical protein